LLFYIPESERHVWISAFDVKPDNVEQILRAAQEKFPEVCVQIVDLNGVAGSRYLFLAILNALKSFNSKRPISKTLAMEVLLYVAASRQISEAIKLVGVTDNTTSIAVIAIGSSSEDVSNVGDFLATVLNRGNRDDLVDRWSPERTRRVRVVFGIGSNELEATKRKNEPIAKAIERLATERSALLTIRK